MPKQHVARNAVRDASCGKAKPKAHARYKVFGCWQSLSLLDCHSSRQRSCGATEACHRQSLNLPRKISNQPAEGNSAAYRVSVTCNFRTGNATMARPCTDLPLRATTPGLWQKNRTPNPKLKRPPRPSMTLEKTDCSKLPESAQDSSCNTSDKRLRCWSCRKPWRRMHDKQKPAARLIIWGVTCSACPARFREHVRLWFIIVCRIMTPRISVGYWCMEPKRVVPD